MADKMEDVDNESSTVKAGDKDKEEKSAIIIRSQDTQLTQPSQAARPASGKRSRSPDSGTTQLQKGVPLRFGSSCSKCRELRTSLKLEIANLKKTNSSHLREVKKLRKEVGVANEEKRELRNTINFIKNSYANLLRDNEDLKSKIAELKKVIIS